MDKNIGMKCYPNQDNRFPSGMYFKILANNGCVSNFVLPKLKILQMNFYKIKKIYIYFDQSVISQSRSFSHLENFSVGKDLISLVSSQAIDLLVNLIFIIAKNNIFKCKLNEKRLNIVEFKNKAMNNIIKEKQYHFRI
jgi:hypothetical protein